LIAPKFLETGPGGPHKLLAPEADASIRMMSEGVGKELEDGQGGDRLAGAAFSYET